MNSCCFVTTITGIACTLANCLSEEELELLAAALSQLGDTIATILANENLLEECCKRKNKSDDSSSQSSDTEGRSETVCPSLIDQ